MPKLKVDLKNGLVEVEGDAELVKEVYGDYKDILSSLISSRQAVDEVAAIEAPATHEIPPKAKPSSAKKVPKKKGSSSTKESYKVLGDLNLLPQGKQSFKDFVKEKKGASEKFSGQEFNTVAVYYLKKILGVEAVTVEHVYSCYKEAGQVLPTALIQSLRDTASLKSTIDTSNTNNMQLTIKGENMIEHELPKVVGK